MALWLRLRALFMSTPSSRTPPSASNLPSVTVSTQSSAFSSRTGLDELPATDVLLDRRFTAHLLGIELLQHRSINPSEQAVLDRLTGLADRGLDPTLVPRLPAVLPKLMSLVRRDDSSARELADLVSQDPTLIGEIIRLSNSARYRTGRTIENIEGAVLVLGQVGLAQLVSRIAMRPIFSLDQGRFGRLAGPKLWTLSERCAHACAWLRAGHDDAFAAFLAGSVAHIGLWAALRVIDQVCTDDPALDSTCFHDELWRTSLALTLLVAKAWGFPDTVLATFEARSGGPSHDRTSALDIALQTADRVARIHLLPPSEQSMKRHPSEMEARTGQELDRAFPSDTPD